MTYNIPLIDKQDVFEIIRDKIAQILAAEVAVQMSLAPVPADYKLRIYSDRINPWEPFLRVEPGDDVSPIVNVWYDTSNFGERGSSNMSTRQATTSTYNIDVYTYAESTEEVTGHTPGDEQSARNVHNAAKLIRNIIMHDKYICLEMPDDVWWRWVQSMTVFQPQSANQAIQRVVGCRIALDVKHNEYILLEDHEILEVVNVEYRYEPDGQIIAELQYGEESP